MPLFGKPINQMVRHNGRLVSRGTINRKVEEQDVHVFDGGGGYYHTTVKPRTVPEGATLKIDGNWYRQFRGGLTPINYCDIPDDVKTTMLLLQLSL